jgi:hypothetical protein
MKNKNKSAIGKADVETSPSIKWRGGFGLFPLTICLWFLMIAGAAYADSKSYESFNEIAYIGSSQHGWLLVKSADANDTPLAAATKTWDDKMADANWCPVNPGNTYHCLACYAHGKDGNDPAQGSFDVNVFAARKYGGIKRVVGATIGIGTTQLSRDPNSGTQFRSGLADPNYKWADAATAVDWDWPVEGLPDSDVTGVDIIEVWWLGLGTEFVKVEITNGTWWYTDHIYCVYTGTGG